MLQTYTKSQIDALIATGSGGSSSPKICSIPVIGEWAADPWIVSEVNDKDTHMSFSYFWAESAWTFDQVAIRTASDLAVILTLSLYKADDNGIKTGAALASGTCDATTAGEKIISMVGTFTAGSNIFEITSTGGKPKTYAVKQTGPGANIMSNPRWAYSLPYPRGTSPDNSNWVPLIWVRRSA